jgi:HAD superfamily hydrolase (TIGR01509 family)
MPRCSLLIFDLDGVLCTNHRARRCAYLGACVGLRADEVEAAIWGSGIETLGDVGELDETAYLQAYRDALKYRLTLHEWVEARRVATEPHPDVLDFVRELKSRVRLAVLTNNTTLISTHIDRIFPELPDLFGSAIYASAQFNAAKPDAACYRRCLAALNIPPLETLFIDDAQENVAGAEKVGMSGYLYTSLDALCDYLKGKGGL